PARRLPVPRRTQGCHQPLRRRHKRQPQTLRLDRRSQPRPCCCQTRETSVRVGPLGLARVPSVVRYDGRKSRAAFAASWWCKEQRGAEEDETVSCHLPCPSIGYSRVEEDRPGSEERSRNENAGPVEEMDGGQRKDVCRCRRGRGENQARQHSGNVRYQKRHHVVLGCTGGIA